MRQDLVRTFVTWPLSIIALAFAAVACSGFDDKDADDGDTGPGTVSEVGPNDVAADVADTDPTDVDDVSADIGGDGSSSDVDADVPSSDADADTFDADTDADEPDAPTPADGPALYQEYCAFCHGDAGEGYVSDNANALANQSFLSAADDEFLTLATIHGRPGTPMSAWGVAKGGPLEDHEVAAIVAHIRGWQTEPSVALGEAPVEGNATRGQGAYAARCADCHGESGEGGTYMSINNPWFLETASDAFIAYAITNGREDTRMRAYADSLPERTINDITALIRSWAVPVDTEPIPPYEPDLDRAVLNPDGPDPAWELREDRYVSIHTVNESIEAGDALVLVDARPTSDFVTSHIAGAINLPFYDIGDYVDELPRDRWVVAYCGCPHAVSGQAADVLIAAGFERVAVLDEGFYEWEDAGYPVVE